MNLIGVDRVWEKDLENGFSPKLERNQGKGEGGCVSGNVHRIINAYVMVIDLKGKSFV